jgi:hypothetical protein
LPFCVWGKRHFEKDQLHSAVDWHGLNPMFGIVLNDVSNNAIVGFSYDLSSLVYLNFGAHFGKGKRLDPNSGLTSRWHLHGKRHHDSHTDSVEDRVFCGVFDGFARRREVLWLSNLEILGV